MPCHESEGSGYYLNRDLDDNASMDRDLLPPRSSALGTLRRLVGMTEEELAEALGVTPETISRWERGKSLVTDEKLARAVEKLSLPRSDLELAVATAERLGRTGEVAAHPLAPSAQDQQRIAASALKIGLFLAERISLEMTEAYSLGVVEELREQAATLAEGLSGRPLAERRLLLESAPEYRTWAMVERLVEIAERAAGSSVKEAEEWADLTLLAAESVEVPACWRPRLRAYALAIAANVQRVANWLGEAEATFARAWAAWHESTADGLPLREWWLLDLEASLRRDQRRWPEVFALHEQSLRTAPPEAKGRIGLKLAAALKVRGEPERALRALADARGPIEVGTDLRLQWVLAFNTALVLLDLGRVREALPFAAEARRLALKGGRALALLRTDWLQGQVEGALGHRAVARLAFARVREEFSKLGLYLDGALAGLDEAVLLLEEGATGEARDLADEMFSAFGSAALGMEALAAIRVFCEAARCEEATVALARQTIDILRNATQLADPPRVE